MSKEKTENNYKKFFENMKKCKSDRNIQECKSLISLAQQYYSCYFQYQKLAEVENKMEHIYKLPADKDGKLILKKDKLDICDRLFVELFLIFVNQGMSDRIRNFENVYDYEDMLNVFEEECSLISSYKIEGESLKNKLGDSCNKALKFYKNEGIDLRMETIRKAVRQYNRYSKFQIKGEEESFNNVFSTQYIDTLIDIINTREEILVLSTAPIRAQLCRPEQGAREMDSKTLKWCYAKDFRLSINELEEGIERFKLYDSKFKEFCRLSKELKKIEKELYPKLLF
ncbi:MAG: hypothetical protein MR675_02255 [Lachnospira sp.]|nr:hypothetical protein [Lachnospira sp.]MDD6303126.1 hypothetical protein [Lachnospiraceae bacterium]